MWRTRGRRYSGCICVRAFLRLH
uniref:Uncharacterized protein n=1 Tax=Anopheles dirus TaxID=7168 RepID=A0A182NYF9_9DIPT